MATRQGHLRQQVESLREELVQHQKAGASPCAEKVARKEIMELRGQVEQWQQEAQAAQAELETVCRQEGNTAERLHQCGEESVRGGETDGRKKR